MYHYNIMNMLQVCLKCVLSKAGNWMWNKVPITIAKQLTAIKTYKSRYKYHSHKSSYNPGHLAHLKKKPQHTGELTATRFSEDQLPKLL